MKRFEQAVKALEIYCKRGEEAIKLLQKGELEKFSEKMETRRHAFLNFRALDHAASHDGFDLAKSPTANKLYRQHLAIQERLTHMIQNEQEDLQGTLQKQSHSLRVSLAYLSKSASSIVRFLKFI